MVNDSTEASGVAVVVSQDDGRVQALEIRNRIGGSGMKENGPLL